MTEIVSINEEFTNGGQPSKNVLTKLKNDGFRSVINLRTPEETRLSLYDSPQQEEKAVHDLGMIYVHIPVNASHPEPHKIDQFAEAISQLPKPIFGHCKSGVRSGAFYLAYKARKNGWDAPKALKYGQDRGIELNDTYKQLLSDYLDQRSANSA